MINVRWQYVCLCAVIPLFLVACSKRKPTDADGAEHAARTAAAVASRTSAEAAETATPAPPASPLVGGWHSVKIEGADIGNFIKEIRYTFSPDGGFVAEAAMTDGGTDRKQGTFRTEGDQMYQFIEDARLNCEFRLDNGQLIVHDPFLDASIWFERDADGAPAMTP
ncbi:MAG: hypothetical protein IH624_11495 [Phycisphaerae bacterium]|nr:hypothetical protein [Phycisphaerae bacterium]